MKNYNEIDGWFDYQKTYTYLVSKVPDNGIFVECGAWLGKSSSYLCDTAQDRIQVFIVDTWKGSSNELETNHILAKTQDIYTLFVNNMKDRKYIPIKKSSEDAANNFQNNSCDVVFIDMTHTYEAVKQDILTWLPKVKKNGYIAGHDYQNAWPGVVAAVNEIFGSENLILMDTCWIYRNK
jgi:hypothetical protein